MLPTHIARIIERIECPADQVAMEAYLAELQGSARPAATTDQQTVKFTSHGNSAPAYSCNLPGDQSGEYVSLQQHHALAAQNARLRKHLHEGSEIIDPLHQLENAWLDKAFLLTEEPEIVSLVELQAHSIASITDEEIDDLLAIGFRHCEVSGDLRIEDIKDAFRIIADQRRQAANAAP